MLTKRSIKFFFEVKHRTDIGLTVDVTSHMFTTGFCYEHSPNMNFKIVAKHLELEISGPDEAEIECINVLYLRSMTLNTIALVVTDLVEIRRMKDMYICG